MASPIETMKQGILAGDWKKVVLGYNRLSGEKQKVPESSGPRSVSPAERAKIEAPLVKAMKAATDVLEAALDTDSLSEEEPHEEEEEEEAARPTLEERAAILRGDRPTPDFTHIQGKPQQDVKEDLGRLCKSEPVRPGMKNQFVDDGRLFKRDIKQDKKLTRGLTPTPRRPAARKVRVTCFKCEKDYRVEPSLAPRGIKTAGANEETHFVCDNCSGRGER